MIEINNLVKKYKEVTAVNGVNLKINEGELFGLLGPNGAGKSTTIRAILGLINHDDGEISICGEHFDVKSYSIKKIMGYVPQDLAFFEELSAYDNVMYWGKLYGLKGKKLAENAKDALESTGLWDRRKGMSKKFSGGMKRRLNIACGIVHKPKILIMDEPTVGVDPQSRNNILDCVRELNKNNTTVLYTSHYMEEIEALCDKVAIMDFGKIIACGTIEEVIDDNCKDQVINMAVNGDVDKKVEKVKQIEGIEKVELESNSINITYTNEVNLEDLLGNILKAGLDLKGVTIKKQNLETVFLKLTGKSLRD